VIEEPCGVDFSTQEVVVARPFGSLRGSLWLPLAEDPRALVLMHPGSGAADRDNDGYFSAIRSYLLSRRYAVASFDKRGVGGSAGAWWSAGIPEQASDVIACIDVLRTLTSHGVPIGLFGHSQGGWVAVEAAASGLELSFLVSNSGPAVTPVAQERHALENRMRAAGVNDDTIVATLDVYDELTGLARQAAPLRAAQDYLNRRRSQQSLAAEEWLTLTDDARSWSELSQLADYDPRPSLSAIRRPLLVLYGADDPLVPVPASVTALLAAVPNALLTVEILSNADHRLQTGQPPSLHPHYFEILETFLTGSA
jgi:pimeloyl-ACP methyl ester carboxylesterase